MTSSTAPQLIDIFYMFTMWQHASPSWSWVHLLQHCSTLMQQRNFNLHKGRRAHNPPVKCLHSVSMAKVKQCSYCLSVTHGKCSVRPMVTVPAVMVTVTMVTVTAAGTSQVWPLTCTRLHRLTTRSTTCRCLSQLWLTLLTRPSILTTISLCRYSWAHRATVISASWALSWTSQPSALRGMPVYFPALPVVLINQPQRDGMLSWHRHAVAQGRDVNLQPHDHKSRTLPHGH